MTLTPEQIAQGWKLHDGSDMCPIKDKRTVHDVMVLGEGVYSAETEAAEWQWSMIHAYRIVEAHGADAEPARPTPWPHDYSELVWDADGWSQTIIVDGKRPEWLRDDDLCISGIHWNEFVGKEWGSELAIRVRRREPKRETVKGYILSHHINERPVVVFDLIDGKPDLSTLKIAEDAL